MTRVGCLLLVCVTWSCSRDDGYAVDLTVIADPSLAESTVAAIRTLDVTVTGAESYELPVPITNQLTSGALRVIYRPGAQSGTLNFSINALDASNEPVAHGETDSVTLKPGATVQATVTLTAAIPPDLGGDLADGGPPDLDLSYFDLAIHDLTPACTLAGCAVTNQGCDPVTGCVPCVAPTANATDFYVDAGSFASATGTQSCPLTTISAALLLANASSAAAKTIHVAPGSYASGETFPLMVRNGISIVGAGANSTFITGHGTFAGYPSGVVTIVIGSDSGASNLLKGVTVQPDGIAVPTTGYLGILCDRGNAVDATVIVPPAPNVVIDSCQVGPNFATGIYVFGSTAPITSGCNLRMVASTVTDASLGVFTGGPAPVNVQLGDSTPAHSNTFTRMRFSLDDGVGLESYDNSFHIDVLGNTFQDSDGGLIIAMSATNPAVINIRGNLFTGLSQFGIVDNGPAQISDLSGNTFTGIGSASGTPPAGFHHCGLCLSRSAGVESALNNRFFGNEVGVEIIGNRVTDTPGAGYRRLDFGELTGNGGNTFSCNSSSASPGHDFWVHDMTGTSDAVILVNGNSWDHAQPTMDEGDGSDLPSPSPSPVGTPQVQFSNPQAPAAASCPAGKVR